jgi:multidrug resistance efflux pump
MASHPDPGTDQAPAYVVKPMVVPPEAAGLAALLQFEAELRRRASVNELVYHLANETRRIVQHDQMFVLRQSSVGARFHAIAVSSIALVDRNAPLIHALERGLAGIADPAQPCDLDPASLSDDPALAEYPFAHFRWQPLFDRKGQAFAGLLAARETPFLEGEAVRLARVAETASHAWLALAGGKPVTRFRGLRRWERRALAAVLVVTALFPVRMTALAPVEVVPERPFVVAAPFAGVISRVEVAPNAAVTRGQPVLTFEDVKVRNEMQQALERLEVAKVKIERATSASFADKDQAGDIATLRAEYDSARADYNYAREVMARSQVTAPVAGMAIYSDRRDWEGRAVNVGDPILQIADPRAVSYRIELPAKEQLALKPGAPVKIWLDAQPLWALDGAVDQASFQARATADGTLAFAVTAKPNGPPPRIGSRGTAKLYGDRVPLIYTVLRRPIASLRQFVGL